MRMSSWRSATKQIPQTSHIQGLTMSDFQPSSFTAVSNIDDNKPGHANLGARLATVLTSPSPSFVYLYDPITPDMTRSVMHKTLASLPRTPLKLVCAAVNCVQCFTARILFDSILNTLAAHDSTWAAGCSVWHGRRGINRSFNDSLDSFLHGLRTLSGELSKSAGTARDEADRIKFVIVYERAERLRDNLPELIIPLVRLGELAQLDITTLFLSAVQWEDVCPSPGFLPEPFRLTVPALSKEDAIAWLINHFPQQEVLSPIDPYNPVLRTLYSHFVENVYSVCSPFTSDPMELAYIIRARWPGFVSPILEDWKIQGEGPYGPPSEDGRMRLAKLFNPSFTNALEILYPRFMSAEEWGAANNPPEGFRLSQSLGRSLPLRNSTSQIDETIPELPRLSAFILVASFLASVNPAKSDIRMLGRAPDGKTRKRRKGGGTRKTKPGIAAKIPQRLLGPMSFPLDRLLAILGTLLEEHDAEFRPSRVGTVGELNEIEVFRVQTLSSILELVSMCLLHRTTPADRIDGPSMFKCKVSYDLALKLARQIDVPLSDLMWEPN